MTVTVGEYYEARMQFSMEGGGSCENLFHIRNTGGAGTQQVSDLVYVTAIGSWIDTAMASLNTRIANGMSTPYIDVWQVSWVVDHWERLRYLMSFVLGWQGTAIDDPLPAGVAALVKFTTALRKHGGRKFVGGLTEASNDTDGSWTAATVAVLGNYGAALLTPIAAVDGGDSVLGDYVTLNQAGFATNTMDGVVVDDRPAYQRRRKLNVGS